MDSGSSPGHGLAPYLTSPTPLYCENFTIQFASNPVFHERTKHIEVDFNLVRERLTAGIITLPHISKDQQTADLFTKAMTSSSHQLLVAKLSLIDLPYGRV